MPAAIFDLENSAMSAPPFRRCRLAVRSFIMKRALRRLKSMNQGMENELSFLQAELQHALFEIIELENELRRLREAQRRRRQAATARQRQWRNNQG